MPGILRKHYLYFALPLCLLVHLMLLTNTTFTAWPEMLSWPYLILKGFAPYRDIAIAHNPLMIVSLTEFFRFSGVGVLELKAFTWGLILITDILLFYIAEKILNPKTGVFALIFYIPLQVLYGGNGLWFDVFLVPFILATFYFAQNNKYLWTGVFWSLAFLVKQSAVWFLIPILVGLGNFEYLNIKQFHAFKFSLLNRIFDRQLKNFIIGAGSVFFVFLFFVFYYQLFLDYFGWAVKFGMFVLPHSQGQVHLPSLKQAIIYFFPFLLFYFSGVRKFPIKMLLWSASGLLFAFPRFELFHFQPSLPFLSIAAGGTVTLLLGKIRSDPKRLTTFAVYLIILFFIFLRYVWINSRTQTRFMDKRTVEIAKYIDTYLKDGEKTYFLNIWENYYYLTDTIPATRPVVPHLKWYMESPGVEEEIVNDLMSESPKYIFVGQPGGGELSSYLPLKVRTFIDSNYRIVNVIDNINVFTR